MKKHTILLLLIIAITACRKDNTQTFTTPIADTTQQTLSLKAVTDWYHQQPDSGTVQTNNLGQKIFNLKKLNPDLTKLTSINIKKGNYWLVKLQGQPTYKGIKLGYRKLAFIKDSTNQIQARILEIIPDLIYIQRKGKAETKDFTGRIFVYDQHYQLTGGLIYSQGKPIGQIKSKPQATASNPNNFRLQTTMMAIIADCTWYDSSYYDAEGIFTVYSENICDYTIYDDSFYSGGGGGGDSDLSTDPYGGGGGSSSATDNPTPDPSNLPGEHNVKINPKSYLDCFASLAGAADLSLQVTIYVQEPFPGTTFNYGPNSVGHTAIGLTATGNGQSITQVMGFYPDASGLAKMHAPGKLADNSQLDYNVSITYNVNAVQFANLINYLNSPLPDYDLIDMNCTGYAEAACHYAGIPLPDGSNVVGLAGPGGATVAQTPAGLGNNLNNMAGQPGVNTNGGTIPTTHGPCD